MATIEDRTGNPPDHTQFDSDTTVAGFNEDGPPQPVSIVDMLRNDLEQINSIQDTLILVPGYENSRLAVKYRLASGRELTDIAQKVWREQKDLYSRGLLAAIDTMVVLCVGLYVQPEGVESPVELDPQEMGMPVSFSDDRLADILGMAPDEPRSARAVVRKLFNNNELAIMAHSTKLQEWLQDTTGEAEQGFWLGE